MQCVLFDGNEKDSKLNGMEWIISEKYFQVSVVCLKARKLKFHCFGYFTHFHLEIG